MIHPLRHGLSFMAVAIDPAAGCTHPDYCSGRKTLSIFKKNEDKKVSHVGFEPTHSCSQGGDAYPQAHWSSQQSPLVLQYLNVSFFKLSAWYSRV